MTANDQSSNNESKPTKLSVVIEYLKECSLLLSSIFLLLCIANKICEMASDFWLKKWSDETQNKPSYALSQKYYRLAIYALLCLLNCFFRFLQNVCFIGMVIKATKHYHKQLLSAVLRSPLSFFESTQSGQIINRFTKDIEATEQNIPNSLGLLVYYFVNLVKIVIIISIATPLFILAIIPISLAYFGIQRYFIPSNRKLKNLQRDSSSHIRSYFIETENGVSTIRAFSVKDRIIKIMQTNIDEYLHLCYSLNVSGRWLALRLEIIGNLITLFAALFAVLSRYNLTTSSAGLSIYASLTLSHTLNTVITKLSVFEANITSIEEIEKYIELKPETEWSNKEQKPPENWPDNGKIDFDNYSFKYRNDLENFLNKITAKIEPGEKIGIVGRTGSGKSSLALSLFRLHDILDGHILHDGNIYIDNVNINKIGLDHLRHKLKTMPQDPFIFSGTIKENLDPFGKYKDDELSSELEKVGLNLELDFKYIQGGKQLRIEYVEISDGQHQLICLARAIISKTKILVMDEATANIDPNTDEHVQQTISREFADCTVLTIAHRLTTIMNSSRIRVLDNGEIVEFGSPAQLLTNTRGVFYSMAQKAGLIS